MSRRVDQTGRYTRAAQAYGFDMALLAELSRLTPAQRIARHRKALRILDALQRGRRRKPA